MININKMRKLVLSDNLNYFDDKMIKRGFNTEVLVKNTLTGETVFTKNTLVIAGSFFFTAKGYNVDAPVVLPTLNDQLVVATTQTPPGYTGLRREECIFGFAVSTDGAGETVGSVKVVKYYEKCFDNVIPFRHVDVGSDLSAPDQLRYALKKDGGAKYSYYVKKFEQTPEIKSMFRSDGVLVTTDIHSTGRTDAIDTFTECVMKISVDDIREWFIANGGIDGAKINSIILLSGYLDGAEYKNVKAVARINIENEMLNDAAKEIEIIYRQYI